MSIDNVSEYFASKKLQISYCLVTCDTFGRPVIWIYVKNNEQKEVCFGNTYIGNWNEIDAITSINDVQTKNFGVFEFCFNVWREYFIKKLIENFGE